MQTLVAVETHRMMPSSQQCAEDSRHILRTMQPEQSLGRTFRGHHKFHTETLRNGADEGGEEKEDAPRHRLKGGEDKKK